MPPQRQRPERNLGSEHHSDDRPGEVQAPRLSQVAAQRSGDRVSDAAERASVAGLASEETEPGCQLRAEEEEPSADKRAGEQHVEVPGPRCVPDPAGKEPGREKSNDHGGVRFGT